VLEVVAVSDRISDTNGEQHGHDPTLIVDLSRGQHHRIDASALPTPEACHGTIVESVATSPPAAAPMSRPDRTPTGAKWARSYIEVALERALAKYLPVGRDAPLLRIRER